jgi:putative FmdB family regulatory protein
MPLYEYKCQSCGETFEIIQKFSDEPLKVHEKCGGPVERLISRSSLQFKGTGWYVTDYAGSGNGKSKQSQEDKRESTASGDSKGKSETKGSETKGSDTKGSESKSSESKSSESKSSSTTPSGTSDKKV